MREKVIIMGAAGRDFHNFNIYFRANQRYDVLAFTATQIPDIEGRCYPAALSGELYPKGIPIYSESELIHLIKSHNIDLVAFSYSDVSHQSLMHKASSVMAAGADFILIGATYTMLKSKKPVVSICAVRTGCGKSQTTRKVAGILRQMNKKVVVVRHPMPYGKLEEQAVQRFSSYTDFDFHKCTFEEREEYEALVDAGIVVYAGIDYETILKSAEQEADIIIWDGGNNDTPFFHPDVHVVLFDPHRAGHELSYYPGEINMIMADIAVINKVDTAPAQKVQQVKNNIQTHAPDAEIIMAESSVLVDEPERIAGKRVLVVEDGPTLTHGGMSFGAGFIAAKQHKAAEIVDPRPAAVGSLKETFNKYPHIESVLPAMGYNAEQILDLQETIETADCDLVLFSTPIHLPRVLSIRKPALRVRYEYKDHGSPTLKETLISKMPSNEKI